MKPPDVSPTAPALRAVRGLLLVLVAAFCVMLWPEWRHNPDLSHGLFAPVIFVLLLREARRHGSLRWLPDRRWVGLATAAACALGFACFALAGLLAASVAWSHALVNFLLAASLAGFLFGGLLILADERVRVQPFNWASLTAIFLWLLAAPLPNGTYARLTLGLQGWVTGSVLQTLHLFGIPARQHGNILELARTTVGIEEACSGIRSLVSCVYAGFFFAAWQIRRPARRAVLIVAAPILALGMNFIRSLVLTLLANSGTDISGAWHDATGFAILGVTAVVLAAFALALETPAPPPPAPAAPAPAPSGGPRWSLRWLWGSVALTLAFAVFYAVKSRPEAGAGQPPPDLAALLPEHPTGWEATTPTDLRQFADILQTTHLLERTYLQAGADGRVRQLNVYVAYWPAGQATVSRVASHTPDACWPGSGWASQAVDETRQTLSLPGLTLAPAEHRLFRNANGFPQHVWFWHVYNGQPINYRDPYSVPALVQLALKYGFRRQGAQYFIRVSSNQPWPEIAGDPLVRDLLTRLATAGL